MASFCWIRPLQVGHGIRRSYRSRAPLSMPYLSIYPNSRHLQKPLLFYPTHHRSISRPPSPRFISSSTPSSDLPTDIDGVPQKTLAERRHFELNYIDEVPHNILADLRRLKHDRWGWVIYRCTYGDDEAWAQFQKLINDRSRKDMARREFPPEVANSLKWTFVSDQSLFDGASRDQLRQHFHAWTKEAEKSEQPRGVDVDGKEYYVASRYQYFIQVDEEVLRTTVDVDPYDNLDWGWVNLVRCWDQDLDLDWREEGREHVDEEDGDEGWMQIAAHMVGADFYEAIGASPEYWYAFYTPPPGLTYY
ncbi:hypothetical protein V491_06550 [Pseudogymnoascus sp. VKM F-3775]|nr:hypothetical protein V491_06550 [Pseudogymnoascus sp. VKM F-3775]